MPGRPRLRLDRAARGASRLLGFGASVALLTAVSLVAIPAMVSASGPDAMAAILTGQAIGAVGAVVIHFGWAITGPARIARGDRAARLAEYVESIVVRLALCVPCGVASALVAFAAAQSDKEMAALGAVSAASIGLTSNWYFVGTNGPYTMLVLETVPRAAGTLAGILAVTTGGAGADGVLWGQLVGMLAGFLLCTAWIVLRGGRPAGWWSSRPGYREVLRVQGNGVMTSAVAAVYGALPLVLVGFVAPTAQPAFAILDKFQKQVTVALSPFVTVMQGWVPQAPRPQLPARIRQAVIAAAAASGLLVVITAVVGRPFIAWLSNDQIEISETAIALTGVALGLSLTGAVVTKACLVALDRLRYVAIVTAVGAVVGLVAVAVLAPVGGATAAMAGVALGAAANLTMGLLGLLGLGEAARSPDHERSLEGNVPS